MKVPQRQICNFDYNKTLKNYFIIIKIYARHIFYSPNGQLSSRVKYHANMTLKKVNIIFEVRNFRCNYIKLLGP